MPSITTLMHNVIQNQSGVGSRAGAAAVTSGALVSATGAAAGALLSVVAERGGASAFASSLGGSERPLEAGAVLSAGGSFNAPLSEAASGGVIAAEASSFVSSLPVVRPSPA